MPASLGCGSSPIPNALGVYSVLAHALTAAHPKKKHPHGNPTRARKPSHPDPRTRRPLPAGRA
eukprot:8298690-Pyramimonas_sp.AAC.1